MIDVYGIKNCDTVKKTLKWLSLNEVPYVFHDYKKEGVKLATLENWCRKVDYNTLINRRGTTWRKLEENTKEGIKTQKNAIELMIAHNSVIKRPVIETSDEKIIVGFDEKALSSALADLK